MKTASTSSALLRHDRRAVREKEKDTVQAAEGLLKLFATASNNAVITPYETTRISEAERFNDDISDNVVSLSREDELQQKLNIAC